MRFIVGLIITIIIFAITIAIRPLLLDGIVLGMLLSTPVLAISTVRGR